MAGHRAAALLHRPDDRVLPRRILQHQQHGHLIQPLQCPWVISPAARIWNSMTTPNLFTRDKLLPKVTPVPLDKSDQTLFQTLMDNPDKPVLHRHLELLPKTMGELMSLYCIPILHHPKTQKQSEIIPQQQEMVSEGLMMSKGRCSTIPYQISGKMTMRFVQANFVWVLVDN